MQNKVENNNVNICYDEDEIDLRELLKTILKYKKIILLFTFVITLLAVVYVYIKQPIYEVKSNIRIGYMKNSKTEKQILVDDISTIVKTLKVVFHVDKDDKIVQKKFISDVYSIETNKKIKDFITIRTIGINNNKALIKNKEVVAYLQKIYKQKIEQYILNKKAKIDNLKSQIDDIKHLEVDSLKDKIDQKNSQIKKLQDKLSFLKNTKIVVLKNKIAYHQQKLKEYQHSVNLLIESAKKTKDNAMQMISSIQMVNYQNLILNSQNKIEDYKTEIEMIRTENIKAINLQIQQIKDEIKKIRYKLDVSLKNQIKLINDKISVLKYDISKQNVQNSTVVGGYILNDYPVKPKKKLIVIVAFITSLILSIFLVFFIEFIKSFKEEN